MILFFDLFSNQDTYVEDEEGLQRRHKVDTTLQVHFFGKKGNQDLHYEGFYKFMDNLQTEVLELEFYEFSKGNIAITEIDFAKILLRYTYLVSFLKIDREIPQKSLLKCIFCYFIGH